MKNIKIGIPKALLFYQYGDLWTSFFEELGCDIIISCNTTREIIEIGNRFSVDEACLAMKIYMGHVYYLLDKCDYILVPRIICLKKNEKLCTNFSALYDLVRNTFDKKIIHYNIDIKKKEDEFYAFVTMGLELGFKYRDIVKSYRKAKEKQIAIQSRKISKQKAIVASTKKLKILLAGHAYNLRDEFIGKPISKMLEDNDVEVIYSDCYDKKYLEKEVKMISPHNYWTYNKEIIASVSHYLDSVDGVILLTVFPCGPDSLSNEMVLRTVNIPIIPIIIDEESGNAGIITRIESFLDILEERRLQDDRKNH